ncbi:helix-turn-helix transcriptional regulator [Brenneria rubrifaciens]|uniref:LuxR family transcriptional regulator n=1 Tax=Brenneria rubrifaciens TaxID=55213 RepID=A0A4P8QUS5_9GAMM|nr:LuxR C-terminal-related transcriptional regulator [Brenneria rubrifaciens]QCR10386.1 LuxR family transcriptional regulator [Brenneria rubrifaciens]
MLSVKPVNRFTLQQARKQCIFIIDGSSEGFEEYYESIRTHFYNMASSFIIINNSLNHQPVCIDKKTILISKSTPIDYLYQLFDTVHLNDRRFFNPVRLSKSEYAVFQYWCAGYTAEAIAAITGLNKKSVLNSKSRLLNKYGLQDKNSLLLIAKILFRDNIIEESGDSHNSLKNNNTMGSFI